MSTCKDCIHNNICKHYVKSLANSKNINFENSIEKFCEIAECDHCEDFQDRSKFIELPCKVGDTVYFIKKGKIIKDSVRDINYFSSWKGFEFNTLADKWYEEDIGHKIYFTLEQAEQALNKKTQKKH